MAEYLIGWPSTVSVVGTLWRKWSASFRIYWDSDLLISDCLKP